MNKKPISTYERLMQDPQFREEYKKEYKEFTLSELLLALMDGDDKSVRKLAKEASSLI
ncbi:MAG: hypothetical protein OXI94_00670 [Gemmatimonadota bacterium]|nr:hypothetical protein [Gemmatimonadota bacterium]